MASSENPPFEIVLSRRLHAVWEKVEALALSIYNSNDGWIDRRPITAPHTLRKLTDDFLELACELDAIAGDIAAEDKQFAERTAALGKGYAEAIGVMERDALTKRLNEIVRAPHKPPEPTP
jgi:hypothetical protein